MAAGHNISGDQREQGSARRVQPPMKIAPACSYVILSGSEGSFPYHQQVRGKILTAFRMTWKLISHNFFKGLR